ncbi:MAG: DNA (cytosine-5-)-methyltransferase, partial [Verrucomicrobia bacterium]|nr:DNA (cytosine-5-)-methyltransferase [Verrucomicrobiota bacterium]
RPVPLRDHRQPEVLMRFLSVCSGMEAASVAWEPLGWKAVGFSEIEPFPCAILKHRFPNTPNYGSLTNYAQWPIAPGSIDLLVGGTPCQSFSVAGLRKGMADPRGNLALVFLGLADRVKPRWIVWENVPGVLSSNGGRDFGAFLGALEQLGYGWAYRVLDAQHFGVPQRRRRVFVVACLGAGGWESAAKVLFEPESLCGDTAKGRKKGQGVASDAQGGAGSGGGLPRTVGTLCADTHPGAYTGQDAYTGRLIPASKPMDESKPIVIDRAAFNQGENAKFDPHIGPADVMDSLVARGPHAVACVTGDITHCLTASSGKGATEDGTGRGAPIVNAITFQPGNLRREAGADPSTTTTTTLKASAGDQMPHVAIVQASELRLRGQITEQTTSPTLLAQTKSGDNDPLAVHPVVPLDGMNLLSRLGECGETHSMQNFDPNDPQFTLRKGGCQHGVLTPMAVRRLTPNECMRLQGFPDNWANIPWKGKPEGQAPDGPQYRAAGNSMAVPVMRWIGSRIAQVEAGEIK